MQTKQIQPNAIKAGNLGDILLIDVREHNELLATGTIQGAVHIPLSKGLNQLYHAVVQSGKKAVVFCRTGARTQAVLREFEKVPQVNIAEMEGGIYNWAKQGYQLVPVKI